MRKACMRHLLLLCCLVRWLCAAHAATKDPYKTLGVSSDASDDEIKRQYRKLALKYHPDKNPKGEKRFMEISAAWDVLSDPDKRRTHDLGGDRGFGHHHHHHHQQQHSHQHSSHSGGHQYYQNFYQQQQEPNSEHLLPSSTSRITSSTFRKLVFHSSKPWLVQVWSENSPPCFDFSSTWEGLWKSASRDKSLVEMGRVHLGTQSNLVFWMNRGIGGFNPQHFEQQPVIVGIEASCYDFNCMKIYSGPLKSASILDFVADALLGLPRIPSVDLSTLTKTLQQRVSPHKVVAIAFSMTEGQGSMSLRQLARNQQSYLQVLRVHYRPEDAEAWEARLGVGVRMGIPLAPPCVLFMRGPGSNPRVLNMAKGEASKLEQNIRDSGLVWQEVPSLRFKTADTLGCTFAPSTDSLDNLNRCDLCVVAMGRLGPEMERARAVLVRLQSRLTNHVMGSSQSKASQALMEGRLRVLWLDASKQGDVCRHYLSDPKAIAQLQKEGMSVEDVCGSSAMVSIGNALRRRPARRAVTLLAFKPATRARTAGTPYLFSISPALGMGLSTAIASTDIEKAAAAAADWVSACHSSAWKHDNLHAVQCHMTSVAAGKPPPLVDDETMSPLETLMAEILSQATRMVTFLIAFFTDDLQNLALKISGIAIATSILVSAFRSFFDTQRAAQQREERRREAQRHREFEEHHRHLQAEQQEQRERTLNQLRQQQGQQQGQQHPEMNFVEEEALLSPGGRGPQAHGLRQQQQQSEVNQEDGLHQQHEQQHLGGNERDEEEEGQGQSEVDEEEEEEGKLQSEVDEEEEEVGSPRIAVHQGRSTARSRHNKGAK